MSFIHRHIFSNGLILLAEPMTGVQSVEVDTETRTVELKFEEPDVTEQDIRGKLEEIGFFPDE